MMKKIFAMSLLGMVTLASCNQASISGSTKSYTFAARTTAGYTDQAGKAARTDLSSGDTLTVLTATKLTPNVKYLAHYHKQGADATKAPCDSAGGVVAGIGGEVTADASGSVTIKGFADTAVLKDGAAKYINIHEAAALSVVPLCAELK